MSDLSLQSQSSSPSPPTVTISNNVEIFKNIQKFEELNTDVINNIEKIHEAEKKLLDTIYRRINESINNSLGVVIPDIRSPNIESKLTATPEVERLAMKQAEALKEMSQFGGDLDDIEEIEEIEEIEDEFSDE